MTTLEKWTEADQYISITWKEEFTRGLVFDVLPCNGETALDLLKNKYPEENIEIISLGIYQKDDPKLILEILRTMDWQMRNAIISTGEVALRVLKNDTIVQKLADAYPERISADYIGDWVETHIGNTFQPMFSYFYDLTVAGILVALAKHPDEFSLKCLDEASNLNIAEMWISPRVAQLLKEEYER